MNQLGLGPVTAVCATIITCTLLGVVIEKIAYTPLRNAPRISLLITAIGVSFFLEYTAELILGSGAKVIPAYYTNQTFRIGSVPLGLTSVITLLVTVLSMLVLTFLVQKTKLGKAMRAVSEDMDAARLMGINVNSTISFTFAVGSALAGLGAGILQILLILRLHGLGLGAQLLRIGDLAVRLGLAVCDDFFDRIQQELFEDQHLDHQVADLGQKGPAVQCDQILVQSHKRLLSFRFSKACAYRCFMNRPGARKISSRPVTKP